MTESRSSIGSLRNVVFDCPNPAELAEFYSVLLGLPVTVREDDWVVVGGGHGEPRVGFQESPEYRPPTFPDPHASQQLHLDVLVDDVDEAEQRVLELGARRLNGEGEDFRVYADPAGHPFCLVWRV